MISPNNDKWTRFYDQKVFFDAKFRELFFITGDRRIQVSELNQIRH